MWKFIILCLFAFATNGCITDDCSKQYMTCDTDLPADQVDMWRGSNLKATLTLDAELEPAVLDAALAAADGWREATQGRLDVQFLMSEGSLPDRYVVRHAFDGELEPAELAAATTTRIIVSDGLGSSRWLQQSLSHEFGHYFGLGHEPDLVDDIMYPFTHEGMPSGPTPDALQDLKELYAW